MRFINTEKIGFLLLSLSFISLFFKNSLNTICILLLISYSFCHFYAIRKGKLKEFKIFFSRHQIGVYFVFYFIACLISLLYSTDTSQGLSYLKRYLVFVFLPLSFFMLPHFKSFKDGVLVRKIFIISLYIVFIYLLINAVLTNQEQGNSLMKYVVNIWESLFYSQNSDAKVKLNYWLFTYEGLSRAINIQPIYLALFTNLAMVFLISLKQSNKVKLWVFWFFFLQFIVFNILLSSRTENFICITLFFTYLYLRSTTKAKLFQSFIVGVLGILIALVIILKNPILKYRVLTVFDSSITHEYLNFSSQNIRYIKWKNGIELGSKSPIFGYGIGDAKSELIEQYRVNGFETGVKNTYNSHNQYIDIWLQSGIFGLLAVFGLFFTVFSKMLKNQLELKLIALVFALSFFTESILDRHWGIVSFVLFLSFVSKYNISQSEKQQF